MSTRDVKIFKLKARGDHGSGKTEMLIAFGRIASSFGMITALSSDGHDMLITSTKAQRRALYGFNRKAATGGFLIVDVNGIGHEFASAEEVEAALIAERAEHPICK